MKMLQMLGSFSDCLFHLWGVLGVLVKLLPLSKEAGLRATDTSKRLASRTGTLVV